MSDESTALLTSVMGAIDVAVFAFDMDEKIVLANPAAERLLNKRGPDIAGHDASALRLQGYLSGETPRLVEGAFGAGSRLELRRSTFYRDGKPHQLLVFADLSRALREEQQLAWQRIVRVLSHEINNSLTPIKSIAHSIKRMISRIPDVPRAAEIQDGLSLIETRSGALGRFLRQYAQLAKLPKPQERPIQILPLARRIAELENRLPIEVRAATDVQVEADPDQLEQLLINIVRNAVDATIETGGKVVDRLDPLRRIPAGHGRGRRAGAPRYIQPLRPVLHDQTPGLRHRPRPEPADRRSPRRHTRAREPRRRPGMPCGAQAAHVVRSLRFAVGDC